MSDQAQGLRDLMNSREEIRKMLLGDDMPMVAGKMSKSGDYENAEYVKLDDAVDRILAAGYAKTLDVSEVWAKVDASMELMGNILYGRDMLTDEAELKVVNDGFDALPNLRRLAAPKERWVPVSRKAFEREADKLGFDLDNNMQNEYLESRTRQAWKLIQALQLPSPPTTPAPTATDGTWRPTPDKPLPGTQSGEGV